MSACQVVYQAVEVVHLLRAAFTHRTATTDQAVPCLPVISQLRVRGVDLIAMQGPQHLDHYMNTNRDPRLHSGRRYGTIPNKR
jgi:hypothetical protein